MLFEYIKKRKTEMKGKSNRIINFKALKNIYFCKGGQTTKLNVLLW